MEEKEKNREEPGCKGCPRENSAIYSRDKETGEWTVRNPSGSIGYNYLYRDEWDWLE
jgi:hypothetical protein